MLKLKEVLLPEGVEEDKKINLSFNKGINSLKYEEKYLFDLFTLKNQVLLDGEILFNEQLLLPNLDENKRLILLLIKSKVFTLSISLNLYIDEKEVFANLQKDLSSLKDLPLITNEDKRNKIIQIFEVLKKYEIIYVLIDFNRRVNNQFKDLINEVLKGYVDDFVILTLEQDPELTKETSFDLFKDKVLTFLEKKQEERRIKKAKRPKKEKRARSCPFNKIFTPLVKHKSLMGKVFTGNIYSFLLSLASVIFSLLFSAIVPLQFFIDELFMGLFLIASSILFFVIAISVNLSLFDFLDIQEKENRPRHIITIIYSEIVIVLAGGSTILLFYILGKYNLLFDLSTYEMVYSIAAFSIFFIHLLIPIFARYIRKFNNLIKSVLFKKKK